MYCSECVSSIRRLLHFHLSPFPSCLPLSLPIDIPFPHKVFLWSIHWVQSPHQLVFNFLALIPVPSCSASYEMRSCVYLYVLSRLFLLSISRVFTAFSFFSLLWSQFPPFFSLLSVPLFFFSSFPPCRAHNCIIERLLSQLTLSPSVSILPHS